ncbi:MAG: glycosyltransferase family 2 protein [Bacteroidetes bacterium]|nr:glycosyltransferase family 2 protein [Bacteroidota bacterium]
MPTLSVCCLVRNEESFLPKMLASLQDIADEIIILDTGSTDRSIEIALEFGAKVESVEWEDDFGAMRNKLLKLATKEWVLMIDADEILLPKDVERIKYAITRKVKAFQCLVMNVFPYKILTSLLPLASIRLFRNDESIFYSGRVHESIFHSLVKQSIEISSSSIEIMHYGFSEGRAIRRFRNKRIFESELLRNPNELWIHAHLGLSFFIDQEFGKAEKSFWIAVSSQTNEIENETRSTIMALIAEIYRLQRKPVQAKLQALRAKRLMPDNSLADYISVLVDLDSKSFDSAERQLEYLDANTLVSQFYKVNKGELYTEIIKCLLHLGKQDKALQYAEIMMETPTYDGMIIGGALSERRKDYERAIEFYQRAMSLSNNPSDIALKIENCQKIMEGV